MIDSVRPPLTLLSEEEDLFRSAVAELAESDVRPRVQAMEEAGKVDAALTAKFFELGLMGIELPEQYGGAGGSLMMVALAVEELSKVDASAAIQVDVQNTLVNYPLHRYGNEEQRARILPRMTSDTVGAMRCRSRARIGRVRPPRGRPCRWWLGTERQQGMDHNGGEANTFVVFANTKPEAGYKGITAFVIERGASGFTVGRKEDKLGIRASSTTALHFENAFVSDANVLGDIGQGYKIAIETLNEGRIGIGAQMIGVAQGALSAATAYLKERKQFGKALAEFQGIQFQVAQAARNSRPPASWYTMRPPEGRRQGYRARRCHGQAVCFADVRTGHLVVRGALWWVRVHSRVSGGEVLSRREDRHNLRRHEQHAVADHCQSRAEIGRLCSPSIRSCAASSSTCWRPV